jgi:hypothetical protein
VSRLKTAPEGDTQNNVARGNTQFYPAKVGYSGPYAINENALEDFVADAYAGAVGMEI